MRFIVPCDFCRQFPPAGWQHDRNCQSTSDLILLDRSTANNGTMNEPLYGMQDSHWKKTQASTPTKEGGSSASAVDTASPFSVCDTTGSVTERYVCSAYGAPTGAANWNSLELVQRKFDTHEAFMVRRDEDVGD